MKFNLAKIFRFALYGVAFVMYVYAIFAAIGNLIGMRGIAGSLGTSLSVAGYFWLILDIALPTIIGTAAFSISRRYAKLRWLILLAGVAVVSIAHLEIMHFVPQGLYFNDLHHAK